jgi:hypothetical protein
VAQEYYGPDPHKTSQFNKKKLNFVRKKLNFVRKNLTLIKQSHEQTCRDQNRYAYTKIHANIKTLENS